MTPDELAQIEADNDRLYEKHNACAQRSATWRSDNKYVDDLMRHLDAAETFPGRAVRLLVAEVRFLQARLLELTTGQGRQTTSRDGMMQRGTP